MPAVRTVEEIALVIALRKFPSPDVDDRFIQLLRVDKRILEWENVFKQLARSYFGPTFGTYLTGYAFDRADIQV